MSEFIKINDTAYFPSYTYNPSSGNLQNADSTPQWYVYENSGIVPILSGIMTAKSNIDGAYVGSFDVSAANGFSADNFYTVEVSGSVNNLTAMSCVKQFRVNDIVDANIVQISGEYVGLANTDINANVIQVSGEYVNTNSLKADVNTALTNYDVATRTHVTSTSGAITDQLSTMDQDIYFANVRYIKDTTNIQDEFAVQWYKNDQPVSSGELTSPAISVYNTNTGAQIITNQLMSYASPNVGVVRYDNTSIMTSGEPYLVETSGTIDASLRTWKTVVGIDLI